VEDDCNFMDLCWFDCVLDLKLFYLVEKLKQLNAQLSKGHQAELARLKADIEREQLKGSTENFENRKVGRRKRQPSQLADIGGFTVNLYIYLFI